MKKQQKHVWVLETSIGGYTNRTYSNALGMRVPLKGLKKKSKAVRIPNMYSTREIARALKRMLDRAKADGEIPSLYTFRVVKFTRA